MMSIRYFRFDRLSPERGWDLLTWCRQRGADEFTITGLMAPSETPRMREFFERLKPFALDSAVRRVLAGTDARLVELWRLTDATEQLLKVALPRGFVTSAIDEELWLEDLTLFRGGEFFVGVQTAEGGGAVRVTDPELVDLRASAFPDEDSLGWIEYSAPVR